MSDPTLRHDFVVGERVRGRADAGPNDRRIRGTIVAIEPHIVGHARDVIVEGYWLEDDGRRTPAYAVYAGSEIERDT